jgi:heptosyltransferase-2
MILKTDCRNFPGDRPCIPNKTMGIKCDDCTYYSPVTFKILIIKFDAVGDVLRTTSILHSLKETYPQSHIKWLTKGNAKDIFKNNQYVDEVLVFEDNDLVPRLLSEEFDLVIHPDASPVSAPFASMVKAKIKKGFLLDRLGKVVAADNDAVEWLEMGAFDEFKKRNKKTYQQILHEIAGLPYKKGEIIVTLTDSEKQFRNNFYNQHNLKRFKKIIGLNTGSSKRWAMKSWRVEGFKELIQMLVTDPEIGILLYGGPDEAERNSYLKSYFPNLIDTGSENTLREFFALMDLADVIVTGDTLALHVATALKKKVICFFGPTSSAEIEDYGRITKLMSDLDCLVCYKPVTDKNPNCMDLISSGMVYNAVMEAVNSPIKI